MIVDTSALVAILLDEEGGAAMLDTLTTATGAIPAPVCVEFLRVAGGQRLGLRAQALALLEQLERLGHVVVAFTSSHAAIATAAEPRYGSGNGHGAPLNLLDLMVYAVARERGEPLLCTGKDFAATDLELHGASRLS
jgi:ribonuclease VapC